MAAATRTGFNLFLLHNLPDSLRFYFFFPLLPSLYSCNQFLLISTLSAFPFSRFALHFHAIAGWLSLSLLVGLFSALCLVSFLFGVWILGQAVRNRTWSMDNSTYGSGRLSTASASWCPPLPLRAFKKISNKFYNNVKDANGDNCNEAEKLHLTTCNCCQTAFSMAFSRAIGVRGER